MKAEETVIPTPDHSESVCCPHCGEEHGIELIVANRREAQAEISFPLGEKQGRKEVVEWSNAPCPHPEGQIKGYIRLKRYCYVCWQAKLKEWGIQE